MFRRALYWFLVMFAASILIAAGAVYFAERAGVLDLAALGKGIAVGVVLGIIAGSASVGSLKRRMQNTIIRKPRGKGLIPAAVFVLFIVFYGEIGSLVCSLIGILERHQCLGATYGGFFGAIAALFVCDLVWAFTWEHRNKQLLYFE
jgi:hypothetical protein